MFDDSMIIAGVSGTIYTPTMSPAIPCEADVLADEIIACGKAGANVAHVVVRKDGMPTLELGCYREVLGLVKGKTDIILSLDATGLPGSTLAERLAVITELKPEMVTVLAGTMNFDISPFAMFVENAETLRYGWELEHVKNGAGFIVNTVSDLRELAAACRAAGTKPLWRVCDTAMVRNLGVLKREGLLDELPAVEFYLGFDQFNGLMNSSVDNLVLLRNALRIEIGDFVWAGSGLERYQFNIAGAAVAMGGGATVGIENSFFCGPGMFAKGSAEHVEKIMRICKEVENDVASPAKLREKLGID